jgi:hypothetical protein
MGDETRIHHYEPESECQSMEWKYSHLPARRKLKMHPTAGKLMLIVFGTHKGYYWNIMKRGFNSAQCSLQ